MFDLLQKYLLKKRFPWPLGKKERPLRALRFIPCPEERYEECLALLDRNIPHGVPASSRADYEEDLRSGLLLTVLVEDGEKVVGTFSLKRGEKPCTVLLCYLFVAPEEHGAGIGRTMLMAVLALLPAKRVDRVIYILALPTAIDFYVRLGFMQLGENVELHQLRCHFGELRASPQMCEAARRWLRLTGAELPTLNGDLPECKKVSES